MEDVHHNVLQLGIHFLKGPAQTLGVLAHFQSGGGYAAGVGSLAGAEQNAVFLQISGGVQRSGHVGTFCHCEATVGNQHLGVIQQQLVLGGAGQSHVALDAPHALTLVIDGVGTSLGVLGQAGTLDLLDIDEGSHIDSVRIVDPAGGVGAGDRLGTQLPGLLNGVGCHVAGAGNHNGLAFQRLTVALEHLVGQVQQTVAGSLGSGQGAAVGQALTGEHAFVQIPDALVLAEQVADFPAAYADVTGGHVGIGADVLVQLGHEALAERHHFPVGLALGVKVRAAFAAADGQTGEGVFEHLLEAQELDHAQVHAGMESQTALVGTDGAVELHTVAVVYLNLTFVVHPGHPEEDGPLGGGQPLQQSVAAVGIFILLNYGAQGLQNLINGLVKFGLIRVLLFDPGQGFIYITHEQTSSLERIGCSTL